MDGSDETLDMDMEEHEDERTPIGLDDRLTTIEGKCDQIMAMLLEVLTWKTELEQSMADMQNGGGLLSMLKMFGK